jgi:hypothetical protein
MKTFRSPKVTRSDRCLEGAGFARHSQGGAADQDGRPFHPGNSGDRKNHTVPKVLISGQSWSNLPRQYLSDSWM